MSTAKYAGYLGGAAVAAGVGVAIAVSGQATAHADDTKTVSEAPGPKKDSPATKLQTTAAKLEKAVTKALPKAPAKTAFDPAKAADGLKKQFEKSLKAAKVAQPKTANPALANRAAQVSKALAPSTADAQPNNDAPFTNPFRADDPDPGPAEMPSAVVGVRNTIVDATPVAELKPVVREGVEAAYRVSQMVPWVNLPVPLLQIGAAAQAGQSVPQVAINQLLLTVPPIGILYYGYDQGADLLNVETAAAVLKEQFYATVWNTLDFIPLLHEPGQSGLPR